MWIRSDGRMHEYQALPMFAGCSRSQLRQVLLAATPLSTVAGTVLARQGERGHQFVIVLAGTAEVWRDGQLIDEIGAGGYFGEIALIRRICEPASIVARTAMTVDVFAPRDVIAKREFAELYALVRERMDEEVDRRLAKWISASPVLDHIALTVPNLDDQVERLTTAFGMVTQFRSEHFAVVADPGSDFKLELSASDDGEVHVRHLGFCTDDVDAAHVSLVAAGMQTSAAPHRQDFARMYTSSLQQPGGVEVQLVDYD